MSTAFTERLVQEHAALRASLPDSIVPAAVRDASLKRAAETGLPGLRDEGWRYAALRPLLTATLGTAAAPTDSESARALLPATLEGIHRLVYVNGRFAPALSADLATLPGLAAQCVSADATTYLAATPDERFAWLNDAFAVDGAQFTVRGEQQLELLFVTVPTASAGASHPRISLALEAGARLTLVERHVGGSEGGLVNAQVQCHLGRDACPGCRTT
jgi:Fe-S cluster assembly protein SufD